MKGWLELLLGEDPPRQAGKRASGARPRPAPPLAVSRSRRKPASASQQRLTLPKGLSKQAAYREASKRATKDFRGFTYDAKTGKAVLT